MGTAFVLGATVFAEAITNLVFGILAIPILVLGVFLILSCEQKQNTKVNVSDEVVFFSSILGTESIEGVKDSGSVASGSELHMSALQSKSAIEKQDVDFDENMHNKSSSFLYEKVDSVSNTIIDMELSSYSNEDRENHALLQYDNTSILTVLSLLRVKFNNFFDQEDTLRTARAVMICILAGLYCLELLFSFSIILEHNN